MSRGGGVGDFQQRVEADLHRDGHPDAGGRPLDAGAVREEGFQRTAGESELAENCRWMHIAHMKTAATFTARIVRDGQWLIAFSPEFPEGNGQGLTEEEALESLRESILLLLEDRREDARASLGSGEKLIPLALA